MNFSSLDKALLRSALGGICEKKRKAIIMRFWFNHDIQEISKALRVSWNEANQLIEQGMSEMKKLLLDEPQFSLSVSNEKVQDAA